MTFTYQSWRVYISEDISSICFIRIRLNSRDKIEFRNYFEIYFSDADLKKRLPDLNPRERVKVINELTEHNVIELVQRGDQLEYKYKKQIHFPKGVEVNEQPIYRYLIFFFRKYESYLLFLIFSY